MLAKTHFMFGLSALAGLSYANGSHRILQGFNSGNTLQNETPKNESDFRKEFETVQSLRNSPGLFNAVRLYTNIQAKPATPIEPLSAFKAAIDTNTSMLLGIWCSGTTNITNELDAMELALKTYGAKFADLVVGISVGSEDLYRVSEKGIAQSGGLPGQGPATIAKFVQDTRKAIRGTLLEDKPVGHVDTWLSWINETNSPVIDAIDWIGVDLYPYYENDTSELPPNLPSGQSNTFANSLPIFDYLYEKTLHAARGKDVWLTETGYPYSGPNWGNAVPSPDNQASYWRQVGCGRLFGRVNTFWYTLRDANPANAQKFAVASDDVTQARFDLSCPAGCGAPPAVNTKSKVEGAEQDDR